MLFLGSGQDASNLEQMCAHGIKYVLNVANDVPNFHSGEGFEYFNLGVGDFGTDAGISRVFGVAVDFVRAARAKEDNEGAVLMHCANGSNRSATVAIVICAELYGWSLRESHAHVKRRHPATNPLSDNRHQL